MSVGFDIRDGDDDDDDDDDDNDDDDDDEDDDDDDERAFERRRDFPENGLINPKARRCCRCGCNVNPPQCLQIANSTNIAGSLTVASYLFVH